jgi:hypothetical protein
MLWHISAQPQWHPPRGQVAIPVSGRSDYLLDSDKPHGWRD